ncbi:MAG: NmrA/HSCARG family protein [Myxococcota bacterium]|nr:NmrA/HSCARG family protein [Myxococcota bacterium]
MSKKKVILVVGATGQQGGAVARTLLAKGDYSVRGLTRSPESKAALELAEQGAELVRGDLRDRAALDAALRGVDGVFGVTTPFELGVQGETEQGIHLVDAALKAGVDHLVFSSVGKADTNTGIPHFDSKYAIEQYLEKSGLPYTIVAPVFFFENWLSPWFLPALIDGNVALVMPADRLLAQISIEDIGRFTALIFEQKEAFLGKRFDIASDDLSGADVARRLGNHTGREFGYFQIPLESVREQSEDFAKMFEWFDQVGYDVDIEGLKQAFPGVGWTDFDTWTAKQDWSVLKGTKTAANA